MSNSQDTQITNWLTHFLSDGGTVEKLTNKMCEEMKWMMTRDFNKILAPALIDDLLAKTNASEISEKLFNHFNDCLSDEKKKIFNSWDFVPSDAPKNKMHHIYLKVIDDNKEHFEEVYKKAISDKINSIVETKATYISEYIAATDSSLHTMLCEQIKEQTIDKMHALLEEKYKEDDYNGNWEFTVTVNFNKTGR